MSIAENYSMWLKNQNTRARQLPWTCFRSGEFVRLKNVEERLLDSW